MSDDDEGGGLVDVAAVLDRLAAAHVPYRSVHTGGGCITVYVGDGDWDEQAERWTQPLSIGPCFLTVGPATRDRGARLAGLLGELTYGPREGDDVGVDEPTEPRVIANALIDMYVHSMLPDKQHEPAALLNQPLPTGQGLVIKPRMRVAYRVEPVTIVGPVPFEPSMVRVRTVRGKVIRVDRANLTPLTREITS